jgi:phenylacetate-CoA ligase
MSSGLAVAIRELRHLPTAWRADRQPPEQIRQQALQEINTMLRYCASQVPYYRQQPYAGRTLRHLGELAELPVLSKRVLLEHGVATFRADGLRPGEYHVDATSGSTGTKLEVWHDAGAYGYHGATVLRRFLRSGYRPWWRIAHLKSYARPVRWFQKLGLFPRTVVATSAPEREIAAGVLAVRPGLIMGYPVMLRALLRNLSTVELATLRRTLKMVMTDSELLTDEIAETLRDGFGVPVFDEYSAFEVLTMSSQCRHGSMHIDEDRVWLEILDDAHEPVPDGVTGAVVVTHFRERAMPLVRYSLGDRASIVPGRCTCGSSFRRMKLVDGRVNDYVTLSDGRRVYSGVFLVLAKWTPGVAECMVRQDDAGQISVYLVLDPRDTVPYEAAMQAFRDRFVEQVGAAYADAAREIQFVRAERIELSAGGKGRFIESDYHPD